MVQQLLVVDLVVDVEAVPQIAADHHTAETEVPRILDVVDVHAAQGIHLLVDESLTRSLSQLLLGKRLLLAVNRLTVEDRLQEHVVRLLLGLLELAHGVTRPRDVALVACRHLCTGIVDVDASQAVLLFQIEMAVNRDLVRQILAQQRQQTLGVQGRRARLAQVEILKTFLEKVDKNLVFLDEKRRFGNDN